MNAPDKPHADWLLTTQECLIKKIDSSLSTRIEHFPEYEKRFLTIQQIPLSKFKQLYFITNTDKNNNYLYIEKINIYINGSSTPVDIIGVEDTLTQMYDFSDTDSFITGGKTHTPWATVVSGFDLQTYITSQIAALPTNLQVDITDGIAFDLVLNPDKRKNNTASRVGDALYTSPGEVKKSGGMRLY